MHLQEYKLGLMRYYTPLKAPLSNILDYIEKNNVPWCEVVACASTQFKRYNNPCVFMYPTLLFYTIDGVHFSAIAIQSFYIQYLTI